MLRGVGKSVGKAVILSGLGLASASAAPSVPVPRPDAIAATAAGAALPRSRPVEVESALPLSDVAAPGTLPRARPAAGINAPPPAEWADERRDFSTATIELGHAEAATLLPRPRPAHRTLAAGPFAAYGRTAEPTSAMLTAFLPPPEVQHISPEDDAACRARLDTLGVSYQPAPDIQFVSAECTIVGALQVSSVGAGMAIAPDATMNCRTTEALALWMRDVVAPAAEKHLKSRPDGIAQASTFVCRPRYNTPGARISEHATGNAVDVASIGIVGRKPVEIREYGETEAAERAFLAEIRSGACGIFTTVLGPGSNEAHATHFHFDLAQRNGGFRLCE